MDKLATSDSIVSMFLYLNYKQVELWFNSKDIIRCHSVLLCQDNDLSHLCDGWGNTSNVYLSEY